MLLNHVDFDSKTAIPGRQETNCPVFAALIDIMGKKANWVILDLGPARAANLELLSRFRCRLFIEDAHELIAAFTGDAVADEATLKEWLGQWAAGNGNQPIDVVLAWDIFNYLDPRLSKTFIDHLMSMLNPGAYLHLVTYSQREMPALPMTFEALSEDKMECQTPVAATRPSPRFNQTDLKKILREFAVVKSVLLRNGMQEYLLRRMAG